MWETFPYVVFGWQEGADVFTIKIYSLRVLISLRRAGTMCRAGSKGGKDTQRKQEGGPTPKNTFKCSEGATHL